MLHIEKKNLLQNLENKKHYVINDKNNPIIFNDRINKRYAQYYSASTNVKYNLTLRHK
jgi:hypothetical protein